eukprot:GHVN01035139.1.p2 GENE.GHVN01035139.1~~GHVN01035139.1.p2  ORF type:complete len:470 (+),score=93.75 GHVN01035139.1:3509-4918(+)
MSNNAHHLLTTLCESLAVRKTVARISFEDVEANPVAFYRDYVAQSTPVVLTGAVDQWDALTRWKGGGLMGGIDGDYLDKLMHEKKSDDIELMGSPPSDTSMISLSQKNGEGDSLITVALTPSGWADGITDVNIKSSHQIPGGDKPPTTQLFMRPAERKMTLSSLFDLIHLAHRHLKTNRLNRQAVTGQPIPSDKERGDCYAPPPSSKEDTPAKPHDDLCRDLWQPVADVQVKAAVAYAQFQNSSLSVEFTNLKCDIDDRVKRFGEFVFGEKCDAENLWIGGDATVTSTHQDWYENLYVVVAGGRKRFHLVNPFQAPWVSKKDVRNGVWSCNADDCRFFTAYQSCINKSCINKEQQEARPSSTSWVSLDAVRDEQVLASRGVLTLIADIEPGEVLYLPAMWFHRVSHCTDYDDRHQPHSKSIDETNPSDQGTSLNGNVPAVVAINYWFDMKFGPTFHLQQYVKDMYSPTD